MEERLKMERKRLKGAKLLDMTAVELTTKAHNHLEKVYLKNVLKEVVHCIPQRIIHKNPLQFTDKQQHHLFNLALNHLISIKEGPKSYIAWGDYKCLAVEMTQLIGKLFNEDEVSNENRIFLDADEGEKQRKVQDLGRGMIYAKILHEIEKPLTIQ